MDLSIPTQLESFLGDAKAQITSTTVRVKVPNRTKLDRRRAKRHDFSHRATLFQACCQNMGYQIQYVGNSESGTTFDVTWPVKT